VEARRFLCSISSGDGLKANTAVRSYTSKWSTHYYGRKHDENRYNCPVEALLKHVPAHLERKTRMFFIECSHVTHLHTLRRKNREIETIEGQVQLTVLQLFSRRWLLPPFLPKVIQPLPYVSATSRWVDALRLQ
jgi:hypothetical protein